MLGRWLLAPLGTGALLCLLLLFSSNTSNAQTIPNWTWPLDSVVNGAIKHFDVRGDQNYIDPSTFTWTVYGGRLFFDKDTSQLAGDGTTVTITGNPANNSTEIWVIWDVFTLPVDTGYIYVSEVSSAGCEKSDTEDSKYQGMIIKVKAPPDVRFLSPETLTCSNEDGVLVEIEIDGFAPFDIKYSLNGVVKDWHVEKGEMIDSDFDGKANNLIIPFNDYPGTTVDLIYQLELLEASSEGVFGEILTYPTHTVYAFVQPDAPVINPVWTEVTTGQTHTMSLSDPGVNPAEWFWELYDASGFLVYDTTTVLSGNLDLPFAFDPGDYELVVYFRSQNGCYSLSDSLGIYIYPLPSISFATTSKSAIGCSAVSTNPDDAFEFELDYQGALTYDLTYAIYNYSSTLLEQVVLDFQTTRNPIISIPNTFINDLIPANNRAWFVRIISAVNGEGVPVNVLDATISGGRDERKITIHPKPIITDDIDFAN